MEAATDYYLIRLCKTSRHILVAVAQQRLRRRRVGAIGNVLVTHVAFYCGCKGVAVNGGQSDTYNYGKYLGRVERG